MGPRLRYPALLLPGASSSNLSLTICARMSISSIQPHEGQQRFPACAVITALSVGAYGHATFKFYDLIFLMGSWEVDVTCVRQRWHSLCHLYHLFPLHLHTASSLRKYKFKRARKEGRRDVGRSHPRITLQVFRKFPRKSSASLILIVTVSSFRQTTAEH